MASRPRRGKQMPLAPPPSKSYIDEEEGSSSSDDSEYSAGSKGRSDGLAVVQGTSGTTISPQSLSKERKGKSKRALNYQETEDMDLDEEDFFPPPTPRVTLDRRRETDRDEFMLDVSGPYDVRRIASRLINDCKTWVSDNRPGDNKFYQGFKRNIEEGQVAFERAIQGGAGSERRVGITNDVLLMLQHTKAVSSVIKTKAELIGIGPVIFDIDSFLNTLKKEFVNEKNRYFPAIAAGNIAKEASHGTRTVMPLVAVVGTYDRDAVMVPKPKRTEPVRTQVQKEVHEGSSIVDGSNFAQEDSPATNCSKELRKVLKVAHEQSKEPVNLFEFALNRDSFSKTIENLFNFGFLVQDGHVSVVKEENGKMKDLSLNIKPEKSQKFKPKTVEDGEGGRNQINRSTYILSFSPQEWKNLCAMSQGENTIEQFQSLLEGHGQDIE